MHHEHQKTQINEFEENISLCSMMKDFYSRKMLSVIILTWFWVVLIFALAVYSGIKYFEAEEPKDLIYYAVLFIIAVEFLALMKIFAWQFIHRNSIKRDLKKLELRINELSEKIGK